MDRFYEDLLRKLHEEYVGPGFSYTTAGTDWTNVFGEAQWSDVPKGHIDVVIDLEKFRRVPLDIRHRFVDYVVYSAKQKGWEKEVEIPRASEHVYRFKRIGCHEPV